MSCKDIKNKFPDYLIGELDVESKTVVKNHVSSCVPCREELENLNEIWIKLGVLPEEQPGKNLREKFYTMLESYKAGLGQEKTSGVNPFRGIWRLLRGLPRRGLWPRRPAYQFAFLIVLLLIGFTVGHFYPPADQAKMDMKQLRQEIRELRQSAALAMLKQRSPSERIRGVNFSSRVENPDKKTLTALLDTLNNDPNVNVRLSAVDALYLFSNVSLVQEGLIQSLSQQESPLVQLALIDLMVEIREKRAIHALKKLIERQKLNPEVKKQAELSLRELI